MNIQQVFTDPAIFLADRGLRLRQEQHNPPPPPPHDNFQVSFSNINIKLDIAVEILS
jgi:hypothetical protein